MTEPITTTSAGGLALFKFLAGTAVASAVASMLGFMLMWPKTAREAAVRLTCTLIASTFFGPFLVVALHSRAPELFASGRQVALLFGLPPDAGLVFVSSPLLVFAGLPAWWILGALVRWLDRRKGADLGQLLRDARKLFAPNPAAPTNRRKK